MLQSASTSQIWWSSLEWTTTTMFPLVADACKCLDPLALMSCKKLHELDAITAADVPHIVLQAGGSQTLKIAPMWSCLQSLRLCEPGESCNDVLVRQRYVHSRLLDATKLLYNKTSSHMQQSAWISHIWWSLLEWTTTTMFPLIADACKCLDLLAQVSCRKLHKLDDMTGADVLHSVLRTGRSQTFNIAPLWSCSQSLRLCEPGKSCMDVLVTRRYVHSRLLDATNLM